MINALNGVIVIQARMGSSRLPGKIMMPLAGSPLLIRMVERVRLAACVSNGDMKLMVATTVASEDNPIEELCQTHGIACFRGHPIDLLDRHYQAALSIGADHVAKIPSDCPLIDPQVIDQVVTYYRANLGRYDFVSNLHPATFPDGNDVEVMPIHVLEHAWKHAHKLYEREHTTPFIWDQPQKFRLGNVELPSGLNYAMSHRWTIDYPEDYQFIATVFEHLYPKNPRFRMDDILQLEKDHPEIHAINAKYAGINWYRHHLGELQTVGHGNTRVQ